MPAPGSAVPDGRFWQVNLGHLLNMVWIAVVIGATWGNLTQRLDTLQRDQTTQLALIARIDEHGSRWDAERWGLVDASLREHERRLARVEDALPYSPLLRQPANPHAQN